MPVCQVRAVIWPLSEDFISLYRRGRGMAISPLVCDVAGG